MGKTNEGTHIFFSYMANDYAGSFAVLRGYVDFYNCHTKSQTRIGDEALKNIHKLVEKEQPLPILHEITDQDGPYAICPRCGLKIEPDRYCPHCGQRLFVEKNDSSKEKLNGNLH